MYPVVIIYDSDLGENKFCCIQDITKIDDLINEQINSFLTEYDMQDCDNTNFYEYLCERVHNEPYNTKDIFEVRYFDIITNKWILYTLNDEKINVFIQSKLNTKNIKNVFEIIDYKIGRTSITVNLLIYDIQLEMFIWKELDYNKKDYYYCSKSFFKINFNNWEDFISGKYDEFEFECKKFSINFEKIDNFSKLIIYKNDKLVLLKTIDENEKKQFVDFINNLLQLIINKL